MDYKYLILAILCLLFSWLGYKIGVFLEKLYDDESYDEVNQTLDDLHCFECEIEMTVKEKNGRLQCSNCGLKH
jgi:hypothetical protein